MRGSINFTVEKQDYVPASWFPFDSNRKRSSSFLEVDRSSISMDMDRRYIVMACKGAQGTFRLDVSTNRKNLVATISLPAILGANDGEANIDAIKAIEGKPLSEDNIPAQNDGFENNLKLCAIDDSKVFVCALLCL
jgi:magnesium-transporting ATPase (P-type)